MLAQRRGMVSSRSVSCRPSPRPSPRKDGERGKIARLTPAREARRRARRRAAAGGARRWRDRRRRWRASRRRCRSAGTSSGNGSSRLPNWALRRLRVALRHGEQQVGLADDAAGGEEVLAAQAHAAAQVVAAELEVLGAQAPPARGDEDVLLRPDRCRGRACRARADGGGAPPRSSTRRRGARGGFPPAAAAARRWPRRACRRTAPAPARAARPARW